MLFCAAVMLGERSGRYMEKLAVGPRVNPHMVSLLYPIERNLRAVAAALEKPLGCASATLLLMPKLCGRLCLAGVLHVV